MSDIEGRDNVRNRIMDSSDDDELSELDEEQFNQLDEIPIDEEVYKLSSHKRISSTGYRAPKEKTRERKKKDLKARSDGRRGKASEEPEEEINEEELDPETRQRRALESRLDDALKPASKRRKRLEEDDIELMQDEKLSKLREEMREAAIADAECIKNGVPAVNKLQLLPQVRLILQKHNLADSILDNNLLEVMRLWLEPLPDASLPAFEIQKELFSAIERLPIKTIHLRESGIGKVILFYQRSKRPQTMIKRLADKLIGDWTRPIMGRSDNYRDKHVVSRAYNPDEYSNRSAPTSTTQDISVAEAAAIRRNRAHIPTAETVTYDVAPKSDSHTLSHNRQDSDQFKRLRMKMLSSRTVKAKKSGVSIEGKELRH